MRVLIGGSREIEDNDYIFGIIERRIGMYEHSGLTIIVGGAKGVDSKAELWAKINGCKIECYKPNWNKYGKAAGYYRNAEMLIKGKPDMAILIWDGKSKGTANMKKLLEKAGIVNYVYVKRSF